MSKTITAIFDGKVLQPEKPLDLKPNQRYTITITNERIKYDRNDRIDSLEEQNKIDP